MVQKPLIKQGYSLAEEIANSVSHGIGLVFGIVGLVLLLVQAVDLNASATAITRVSSGSQMAGWLPMLGSGASRIKLCTTAANINRAEDSPSSCWRAVGSVCCCDAASRLNRPIRAR